MKYVKKKTRQNRFSLVRIRPEATGRISIRHVGKMLHIKIAAVLKG
jgi:hypothetical protein